MFASLLLAVGTVLLWTGRDDGGKTVPAREGPRVGPVEVPGRLAGRFELRGEPVWSRARAGEWVELGFELSGATRAKVEFSDRREDGSWTVGLRLPSGLGFSAGGRGGEWSGLALKAGEALAWQVEGDGEEVSVWQVRVADVMCAWEPREGVVVGGLPAIEASGGVDAGGGGEVAGAAAVLDSLPGAAGVIYLDFDGETVTGTSWNSSFNGGASIVARAAPFSASQIEQVWKGMAEDFRPFGVSVTTDRARYLATPVNRRTMVIFTPDNEWYGGAGGVAYVGTFGSWTDTPCWVFTDQVSNNAGFAAEAGSHEAGHTLGLRHDGNTKSDGTLNEYYSGHGSGETTWAPIMGNSYSRKVTQWSRGEYPNANRTEDDLAIISGTYNGLGYRDDDHGNTLATASFLTPLSSTQVEAAGVIERQTDLDVFWFTTSGGAVSFTALNGDVDPNLDIRLRLLSAAGAQVAVADPAGSLDATLSATLAPGSYALEVDGTGTGDWSTGYGDYGSLGGYRISGTVPMVVEVTASISSPEAPQVSVPLGTGLIVAGEAKVGQARWEIVSEPLAGALEIGNAGARETELRFGAAGLYRLRFVTTFDGEDVWDELEVEVTQGGQPASFGTRGAGIELGPDRDTYRDALPLEAVLSDPDATVMWSVVSGPGVVVSGNLVEFSSPGAPVTVRADVEYGGVRTFATVTLVPRFRWQEAVGVESLARILVPKGAVGSWTLPEFDDAAWRTGYPGVGYEAVSSERDRIFSDLIGPGGDVTAEMRGIASSCFVRIEFRVDDPALVLGGVLRMHYEDGFVAYLNGQEVARANVPAGAPSWNSVAAVNRTDSAALTAAVFPLAEVASLLREGRNVLAVHGMNNSKGVNNARFLVSPRLELTTADTPFARAMDVVWEPELRGAGADADGDGRSNLLEHASGTRIDAPDPGLALVEVLDRQLALLRLPPKPPSDVRYVLETSADLDGPWQVVTERVGASAWQGAEPLDQTVSASGTASAFAAGEPDAGFFRVRVELVIPE